MWLCTCKEIFVKIAAKFPDRECSLCYFTSFHILSLMLRIQASLMSLLSLSHPPEISTWGFGAPASRHEAWPSLPTGQATSSDAPSPSASLVHDCMRCMKWKYQQLSSSRCLDLADLQASSEGLHVPILYWNHCRCCSHILTWTMQKEGPSRNP